jgi:heme-degrading monooxygenase HmoA
MHARLARYTLKSGDRHELTRLAAEGMLPILQEQPGFRAYSLAATEDEVYSFSVWDDAEAAEAANSVVAKWVAENLSGNIDLVEHRTAEVLLSTALGVMP